MKRIIHSTEQKYELCEKYKVDVTRLSRNWVEFPIEYDKGNKIVGEVPTKQDIHYLNIELNLGVKISAVILGVSEVCLRKLVIQYGEQKSKELRNELRRQTLLEMYGVTNVSQCDEFQQKKKQTFVKRFGADNPMKNSDVRAKARKTNLEKWGCEYASRNPEIREKQKQSMVDTYGVACSFQNPESRAKGRETCKRLYGNEIPMRNSEIKQKQRATINSKTDEQKALTKQRKSDAANLAWLLHGDEIREKRIKTFQQNWGVDFYSKTERFKQQIKTVYEHRTAEQWQEIVAKSKQTRKEKYDDENYNNLEKAKQTNLERYSYEFAGQNPEIQEKRKQTCLENWGVEYPTQNPQIRAKTVETNRRIYNADCPLQNEDVKNKLKQTNQEKYGGNAATCNLDVQQKQQQTCFEHWGVLYPSQSAEIREKQKQTNLERWGYENAAKSEIVKQKVAQTFQEKYNSPNYFSSEQYAIDMMNKFGVEHSTQSPLVQEKQYHTKKQNNTFNSSKDENRIYSKLLEKFPDTIHQHRDGNRYPFACDFYIPSLDLFIEYQGTWTHGGHPYDENNCDDIAKVEVWKKKSQEINFKGEQKKSYSNAMKVWTVSDVLKRETARKNLLNWIEFFDEKQFLNWFNNL